MTKTCGDCGAFAHPGQCNAVAYLNHQLARERTAREAAEEAKAAAERERDGLLVALDESMKAAEATATALRAELEKAREENTRQRAAVESLAVAFEGYAESAGRSCEARWQTRCQTWGHAAAQVRGLLKPSSDNTANRKPEPTPSIIAGAIDEGGGT